jgi:hypothetical protein
MLRQSRDAFYVCVHAREGGHLEVRLPSGGFGAFTGAEAAGKALVGAIEKYGPAFRCVIEPVEFEGAAPPERGSDEWYRQEARLNFEEGGVIEIDPEAAPSRGDDKGAYVMAWVWVECEKAAEVDPLGGKGRRILSAWMREVESS